MKTFHALLSLLALVAPASAATYTDQGFGLVVSGQLALSDPESFAAQIRRRAATGNPVKAVLLNSDGGNVAAAIRMADIVKKNGISTVVASGDTCSSSCFIIFANGAQRFAFQPNYHIGVHRVTNMQGSEVSDGTMLVANIYSQSGVSPQVIGKMVTTPPGQITWLDEADLRSFGVTVTNPNPSMVGQSIPSPTGIPAGFNCNVRFTQGARGHLSFSLARAIRGGAEYTDNERKTWTMRQNGQNATLVVPLEVGNGWITFNNFDFTNGPAWEGAMSIDGGTDDPLQIARLKCNRSTMEPSRITSAQITETPAGDVVSRWHNLVEASVQLSAQQNGGQAKTGKICQQESCYNVVIYKTPDGRVGMVRATRAARTQQITRREECIFNLALTNLTCRDFETGEIQQAAVRADGF